jgi:PAS domain S-box-containing protein
VSTRATGDELLRELSVQQLLDFSPDAIIGIGEDGRVLLVNQQAEQMFGYDREALQGQPVEMLIPERFRAVHTEHRAGYFQDPRTRPMGPRLDVYGLRRDGSEFSAEISLSPVQGSAGVVAIAAIRDVSDRVNRGREREALQAESTGHEREALEGQLNQARRLESVGQLAGGIAHDFNNLLAVVLNYADFVIEELDEGSPAAEDVRAIRTAAERGVTLIRQLLIFSRGEVTQPEPLDLNDVVASVEDMLGSTLGEHIELEMRFDPELWTVVADRGQIEQLLVNLAVNARDAMPDGGSLVIATGNARLDAENENVSDGAPPRDFVRLNVSDTGIGMAPDVVRRAFEPFYTTKLKGQGTGLGLSTVYGIVQELGGTVSLYSKVGEGTALKVHLPATSAGTATKRPRARVPVRGDGETILVVEDADAVRAMARRILARNGYAVLEARGGQEALDIIGSTSEPIALMLTDVIMSGMLGPDLAERVRELLPDARILFMSGYTGEVLERERIRQGGAAFIEKPFESADLLAKVHTLLHPGA